MPENELVEALETGGVDSAGSVGGARPVDPNLLEEVRSQRGGARPGAGRPRGRPKKKVEPEPELSPPIDPETMRLLEAQLVSSYELLLSFFAVARIVFTDEEKPTVGASLVFCIETYLPEGIAKHMPAVALVAVSLNAINRARAEKAAKKK